METKTYHPDSSHVTSAFYEKMLGFSADLRSNAGRFGTLDDAGHRSAIETLLQKEALLLDDHYLDDWLALFGDHCVYWIPAEPGAADPREQIALEFHDRRRLIDRVTRIRTGVAFSQVPPSRTVRVVSPPRIWPAEGETAIWHARSNFLLDEYRAGKRRSLAGWYGYRVCLADGNYRIDVKQINLIDCDRPQGNNSFFL